MENYRVELQSCQIRNSGLAEANEKLRQELEKIRYENNDLYSKQKELHDLGERQRSEHNELIERSTRDLLQGKEEYVQQIENLKSENLELNEQMDGLVATIKKVYNY